MTTNNVESNDNTVEETPNYEKAKAIFGVVAVAGAIGTLVILSAEQSTLRQVVMNQQNVIDKILDELEFSKTPVQSD